MKSIRYFTYSSVVALLLSAGAVRAADESPYKFEFHGFVTGSMFIQNQVFVGGTGQDNLMSAPSPTGSAPRDPVPATPTDGQASKSGTFLGADARQSRWIFAMSGPQAWGATPKGYFEGDIYGADTASANAAATNAWEHTQLRIRAAFGELKWGTTQLQVGQYSAQLILAQLSASVAHVANPITFGTGTIGSRGVGVRVVHGMPLGDMKLELAAEALAPKWNDPARVGPFTPGTISQAWASGMPQIGARAKVDGKSGNLAFSGYVVGEFQSVNLKGFGDSFVRGGQPGVVLADGSRKTSLSPYALELGGNVLFAPVSVAFNLYTGKATGAWAGSMNQAGDITDLGWWAQLGIHPTKQLSLFGLIGMNASDEKEVRLWGGSRSDNTMYGGIARFSDGGYTFALEYYSMSTKYLLGDWAAYQAGTSTTKTTDGYQFIASANYAW